MSRKYRQRGYQDDNREKPERSKLDRPRPKREGPRSPRMMGFQKLMRCDTCGASLPVHTEEITSQSQCPSCEADLHTCRHCVYFDTSAQFECTQPIRKRVSPKHKANECGFFEAKTRVEKMTTSKNDMRRPNTSGAEDPREAFERLFKK